MSYLSYKLNWFDVFEEFVMLCSAYLLRIPGLTLRTSASKDSK